MPFLVIFLTEKSNTFLQQKIMEKKKKKKYLSFNEKLNKSLFKKIKLNK